ncbi:hypothetical protein [Membranihabitans marinus]|uniref:hypothetical protein n=1 Tax=Membranihabitans marinus TaxID=1227546 RepID=UPI001F252E47|nr:hypothetical protein [Membranihabitans marinus]
MKNIYLMLSGLVLVLGLFSCDSLKDTYAELDENYQDPSGIQELSITMGDDEYQLLEDVDGAESIANYKSFSSEDEAKTYIPYVLDYLYPQLGKGASASVDYHIYSAIVSNNEYSFELTDADYQALGQEEGSLDSQWDVFDAVEYKLANPEHLDLVSLEYVYDDGTTVDTVIGKIARYNDDWLLADQPTSEEYAMMGQSFPNFSSRTTAKRNLAILLDQKYPFAYEGDVKAVVFTYTYVPSGGDRVFEDYLAIFEFDGSQWMVIPDLKVANLKFGFDGSQWVPDNTIRFTLSSADFSLIGGNQGGDAGESAGNYGNFDRRPTGSAYWSDEMILAGINFLLNTNYPSSAVGQKYLITYAIYDGGAGTEDIYVIKDSSGEYIYYEE